MKAAFFILGECRLFLAIARMPEVSGIFCFMPFSGPDDPKLPDNIKELSEDKRSQWAAIWNSVFDRCMADNGETSECESSAFAQANGVVLNRGVDMERQDEQAMNIFSRFWSELKSLFAVDRRIKDVDEWDGSASRWPSTEAYCSDCLINANPAAGRTNPDDWTQALCKLPIREPGDSDDTFVRQAVFAAQAGRGITRLEKPADVSQDDWDRLIKAAAGKLIAANEEMDRVAPPAVFELADREPPEERAISFERIWLQAMQALPLDEFLIDIFVDQGQMYALTTMNGQLYRNNIGIINDEVVLSDRLLVTESHPPIQVRTTITRQADGRYRWLSISATSVLNRVGQIDSRDLFDSFIEHIERTGEYPIRQFYHLGEGFRTGQCDYVARDGYCLITSGLYDDTLLAELEIKARQDEPDYWGQSIGYFPTSEPDLIPITEQINIPVYRTGIFSEDSTLPEKEAANLFTRTQHQEVTRMLEGKAREALLKLFQNDEKAMDEWLKENPERLNRKIDDEGMITRQQDGEEAEAQETEEAETEVPETESETTETEASEETVIELDDDLIGVVISRMHEAGFASTEDVAASIKALTGQISTLTEQIKKGQQEIRERLEPLEADEVQRRQEVMDDMPEGTLKRFSYKPRNTPSKQENGDDEPSMDITANETIDKILGR